MNAALLQVVNDTRRSRSDIDMALEAMLKRQNLPGGRVPVQTTGESDLCIRALTMRCPILTWRVSERLFREAVPLLKEILLGRKVPLPDGGTAQVEKILAAIGDFNFATLPYEDLFFSWDVSEVPHQRHVMVFALGRSC